MKHLQSVALRENRFGNTFIFGQFGKGKNSLVITLQELHAGDSNERALEFWENRIGKSQTEIEVIIETVKHIKEMRV
jgi:hypothetical protein